MTATALAEIVQPGELYVPEGLDVNMESEDWALPNEDSAINILDSATTNEFKAYREEPFDAMTEANWLMGTGACSLSFWIRRKQPFVSTSPMTVGVTANAPDSAAGVLMGVQDPAGAARAPSNRTYSWGITTASDTAIQFFMLGWESGAYKYLTSDPIALVQDQWHFIVINRKAAAKATSGNRGRFVVYTDNTVSTPESSASWNFYPNAANLQRFGLGDLTSLEKSISGSTMTGSLLNVAKVAFHDHELTGNERLQMADSMYYGPAS